MEIPTPAQRYPLPRDEQERLEDLRALAVLDTPRERSFDGIVEIAAALFDAPMAAVTLIDEDRQWLKASVGINVCQTDREGSFCTHTILSYSTMVVEDASLDDRFRASPLVTGPLGVRFYAGVPLTTHRGRRIGALCVIDTVPRTVERHRLRLLERLASLAVDALESRRM